MIGDFAVIPVREFATAKFRLRAALSSENRAALTAALLKRVASAIQLSQMEQAVVVASNSLEASACLQGFSKLFVIAENQYHGGVNSAMKTGIDFAVRRGANTITMLPSDLPFITYAKIDDAIDLLRERDLIINPSLRKDGTNLLALKSKVQFELHYDDDSFARHSKEAISSQLDFQTLDWPEFSIDLDEVIDLERAMRLYKSPSFEAFLYKIPAGIN